MIVYPIKVNNSMILRIQFYTSALGMLRGCAHIFI